MSHEDVAKLVSDRLLAEEALSSLSEEERQAIELVPMWGLTNSEAATEMGKSYDGFTCLLCRARQKAARFIEENS